MRCAGASGLQPGFWLPRRRGRRLVLKGHTTARSFEIEFDFIDHVLRLSTSDGGQARPLRAQPVAEFYEGVMAMLRGLDIRLKINQTPNEIPGAIRFSEDRVHAAYDPQYATRFVRVLAQAARVFKHFRTGFLGKASRCISSGGASTWR